MIIKGWAAPEVARVYNQARTLCQQVGDTPQLFPVLWGLWLFYIGRGEVQAARELGEPLLSLAQRVQDPALLVEGYHALGPTLFWLGELPAARAYLAQGITLYDAQQHRASLLYGGHDPGCCCRLYGALTLEGLRLARELAHPFTLANTLHFAAVLHQFHREEQATHEHAEASMSLATEHGVAPWVAGARVLRGWVLATQGEMDAGLVQMWEGLAAWEAMGLELYRTYQLVLLAEAYGKAGQADEGLRVLGQARAAVHNTEGRFYETELSRLQGELTLARVAGQQAEAEACFQQALTIARRQQAKSLELRAAMSLVRLWQH
jgi:predicted ATPase